MQWRGVQATLWRALSGLVVGSIGSRPEIGMAGRATPENCDRKFESEKGCRSVLPEPGGTSFESAPGTARSCASISRAKEVSVEWASKTWQLEPPSFPPERPTLATAPPGSDGPTAYPESGVFEC